MPRSLPAMAAVTGAVTLVAAFPPCTSTI
jgi:hypothetical protein